MVASAIPIASPGKQWDQLCINTIRTLAMDAVQQANSGHPGTPMGMAPVIYCLWQQFLRFDPEDPIWPNRDRLHFGIREHAMGSILNGMALSKVRPFGSGFLIFSDYVRPAIRLAALMEIPAIYIFTHDSIGVGEDGPTHQPIEHLISLRAIPNLITLRPGDANEVVEAWRVIMQLRHKPAVLVSLASGDAYVGSHSLRPCFRGRQGRLHIGGCSGWQTRNSLPCHRHRSWTGDRSLRKTGCRRRAGQGCEHAVVGTFRAAVTTISGHRDSARSDGAYLSRARFDLGLGTLPRIRRAPDWDEDIRGLRSTERIAKEVRLYT